LIKPYSRKGSSIKIKDAEVQTEGRDLTKKFAPDYPRNKDGLILFPTDDSQARKGLFPQLNPTEHPAKANIFLVQAIVEYVSQVGDTVMDIMAGSGTIMLAALLGRRVVCIDIEEEYVRIMEQGAKSLEDIAPGVESAITIIEGDCIKILPLPVADHIIFSPPYADIMKSKGKLSSFAKDKVPTVQRYSKHPDNISNLNEFIYHQRMEIIYKRVFDSLPVGGTLTIIIKDHIKQGKRVLLGARAERDCIRAGFEPAGHWKWLPHGSAFTGIHKAQGWTVVEDEDVYLLRRP